ncbi:energy-coupling factor transporter transmembrane protein EcfT [Apilactobacillus micheneri]|uniref:Energy-coupling factor transporter transmembrane protein EcfT n=1 Tax=Apilactobacillus micheneri TaxID=1899430 RepID=A0ABY2YYT0_9LACO|nr:energy-coupling factor transporter transmembrane component T [Apilactobacillus micheneri]TPR26368.1 energy-coupling factor transporter transmembrane protein EcfT [Apilactobacillus micheneri]TPR27122.1 energy-coupling factor transporter transmembrane protein EcfT [Apilactobacillus micheneri]TPR27370.1 energy-coupling factor transporter transmembrane protein EcfT [Apilactobacillus micheneri]TPR31885.1 energy-coupling factor transporter transmembrane protein EcfT [Apilactobacillus micheneri]TP
MKPNKLNDLPDWIKNSNYNYKVNYRKSLWKNNRMHIKNLLSSLAQPKGVSYVHRRGSPGVNLIQLLISVLLIVLIHNITLLWIIYILLLFKLLFLNPQQLRKFIKSWIIGSIIASLLIIPSYWLTGISTVLYFTIKTSLILANAQYYRITTPFQELLTGLKALHFPDMFIMIIAISLTYIRMLGQNLFLNLEALELRTVSKNKHPYKLIGAIFGALYLKSCDYAIELYAAMEARGFNGHYKSIKVKNNNFKDFVTLSPAIIVLLLFVLWRK